MRGGGTNDPHPKDNNIGISGIGFVVTASETGQKSPKHLTPLHVEVFTTTVSNVLEWLVDYTLTEAGTL